uniref:CRAL-TRIO domain-containing protein n=1 Tax=Anopheles minimus TaxID=112268 RepID=A0A182VUK4_9DIPT
TAKDEIGVKNQISVPPPRYTACRLWKGPKILCRMPEPEGVMHKLYMERQLPPKVAEVARVQGEDPDRTSLLIEELRDMIYEKGECIPHRVDDDYLIKFLRARFWNVHHAYNLMVRYYAFRESNPEFYENVNPMSLRSLGDDDIISISPYRDQEGRRVICFKFGKWRPAKIPIVDLFRATMLLLEVGSLEPQSQVLGGIGIMDLEGLTLNHAWNLTPAVAQKMLALLATSMPLRTSQIHIVNQGWVFDTAFQIFKPLLTEKMRQRLFFHGTDRASLHKYIDPEALPERYGGTKPEYPYTYWLEHLSRNEKVVDELQQLGYVETATRHRRCHPIMPEIKAVTKSAPNGKSQPEDVTDSNAPVALFADQPERLKKINELRKLIQNYDDCNRRSDDLFLCRFLFCCDWDVEEAFGRIVKLIKLKEANPEWFFHKPIATYGELLNRNVKFALERRDRRGRRVFVTRLGAIDFSNMAVTDLANLDDIWFELMLNELETLESGVTCLIDMSGYSLKSFRFLTPQNIRIGSAKTDLLPLKNIEFHVVNSSVFMNAAIAILYPMLSKKIKDQVRFHYSNWESLHEYIPADILPQEYGGTSGKQFDFKTIYGQVLDRPNEFDRLLAYGVRKNVTTSTAASKVKGTKTKGKHKDADKKKPVTGSVVEETMKLLLVGFFAVCLGQLQAGPVAIPSERVPSADTRARFFTEFNNLLNGIAKEALVSLSSLEQNTASQFRSVEDAIQDLEKLYNEKVLKEITKYDGALDELKSKVSPCFSEVPQDIRDIVEGARNKAGQCGKATLDRVHAIERNIRDHIAQGAEKVKQIIAIGQKCLSDNSWIGDQINCALQNAPVAVSIVEGIVRDAAVLIGQTTREVSALAKDTEQCLAVAVQDAALEFNGMLTKVVDCLDENVTYREKAEKELGETGGELTYTKIRQLRQQLNIYNENHQRALGCRRDDSFLLRFLRAKKFDVEKAFKMMQKYYKMKEEYPEIFKVSPPSEMKFMLEMQIQTMLPKKDEHGRQIYLFRVEKCDPYKIPVDYVFRSNVLALEDAVRSPETQIGGLVVLLDMAGLGFAHARYLSPHLAKKTVEVVQEAFPLRFKAFHVLHEPFYFDAILAVLKPFLKDKIRRRIHLHGNSLSSLHKYVSKDLLPVQYGGNLGPFDNTEWRQTILDNEQYFIDLETYNHLSESCYQLGASNGGDGDAESIDSLQFGDTETEDSEFDEDDRRVLSPKRNARSIQNIEEIFLKNGYDGMAPSVTGTDLEKEVEELK